MGGLPCWSRDETLLAMWTAAFLGPRVAIDDPVVIDLSLLFRSAAPAAASDRRFRNPHGVARKIWSYLDLLDGAPAKRLTPVMESVWSEFAEDRERLAAEAARACCRLVEAAGRGEIPSHGPPPARCSIVERDPTGPCWVYAAVLEGIVVQPGTVFIKIGHSNDVGRREDDLNFSLPRPLGLRWSMIASWALPNAMAAYHAEQAILRSEAAVGRSAGGEFLLVEMSGVEDMLRRCRRTSDQHRGYSDEVAPSGGSVHLRDRETIGECWA